MNNLITDSSIRKDILHIAFPVLFLQLSVIGRTFVATYVINQVDTAAIASFAVGLGIIQTLVMLTRGMLTTIIIINIHQKSISIIFNNYFIPYIVIIFIIISLFSFFLFIFPKISVFFRISPELEHDVNLFLRSYIIGIPAFVFGSALRSHLLSFRKGKIIGITNITGFIICALFTVIFSWKPLQLGAVGFAYASALAFWYTLSHLLYYAWKTKLLPTTLKNTSCKLSNIIEILKEGIPMSMLFSVEPVFFTILVLATQKYTIEYITAYQIVMQLTLLVLIWPLSVGQGVMITVGHNYSNGTINQSIKKIIKNMLFIGMFVIIFSIVIIFILKQHYLKIFFTEQRYINIGILYLYPVFIFLLTDGYAIMHVSILRGLRQTLFPLISMLISYWLIGGSIIIFLYFYTKATPVSFLWALSFSSALRAISYFIYVRKIIPVLAVKEH